MHVSPAYCCKTQPRFTHAICTKWFRSCVYVHISRCSVYVWAKVFVKKAVREITAGERKKETAVVLKCQGIALEESAGQHCYVNSTHAPIYDLRKVSRGTCDQNKRKCVCFVLLFRGDHVSPFWAQSYKSVQSKPKTGDKFHSAN